MTQIDEKALTRAAVIYASWLDAGKLRPREAASCVVKAYLESAPPLTAAASPAPEVAGLVGQLMAGVIACGEQETDDGCVELFDIDGANDTMYDAAAALTSQAERIADLERQLDLQKSQSAWYADHMHVANRHAGRAEEA